MKLVTDGDKFAIKRRWLITFWFDFNDPDDRWKFYPEGDCWTDKETAEKWLRRLKA